MSIFVKETIVAEMREWLAPAIRTYLAGIVLSDDFIWSKVRAAEADAAQKLRVFLEPTKVLPFGHDPSEEPTDMPWAEEPAYDYDPDFFVNNRWGYIITRQSPIIEVEKMEFAYPAPTQSILRVPNDWLRLDKKYGHIRLVPSSQAFMAPLGAYIMQALGGGRTIPHMISVTYIAGLKDVFEDYPNLIELIKMMAGLKIILGAFVPASGSISADGLSRSMSVDTAKFQDQIDYELNGPKGSNGGLMSEIHGIRSMVIM
jgi:hypothetical protein